MYIVSLIVLVIISSLLIVGIFQGKSSLIVPVFLVIIYLLYVGFDSYEEYKLYRLDKVEGIRTETLMLCNHTFQSNPFLKKKNNEPPPIATFKVIKLVNKKDKNSHIALNGDFTKVSLVIGRKYRVSYYKHTKMMVSIKELDSNYGKNNHK